METFRGRFLRYRFDFAALALDCAATFFREKQPLARVLSLVAALAMIAPPVFVLAFGPERFGESWAFGLALILVPLALEIPGYRWRRQVANGSQNVEASFDVFLFVLFSAVAIAAPILLFEVPDPPPVLLGVIWGVALVGAQDLVRSAIACALALARGRPVYA